MKKTLTLVTLAVLVLSLGFASACGICGDGKLDPNEGCDDGNILPNDGCSPTCQPEFCGDGIVQTWEQCEKHQEGCTQNCTWIPQVPEFGTVLGILTALGALGIFFVVRR